MTLGLEVGFAERFADEGPDHGVIAGINLSAGLDDTWTLRTRLSYSTHPGEEEFRAFSSTIEILYLFDVFEFVPYFGVGPDVMGSMWLEKLKILAAVHGLVGVDYLYSREVIFGFEVRPYLILSDMDKQPAYLTATLSANYVFDM